MNQIWELTLDKELCCVIDTSRRVAGDTRVGTAVSWRHLVEYQECEKSSTLLFLHLWCEQRWHVLAFVINNLQLFKNEVKKVKQSRYRPGVAQRVPGCSQITWQRHRMVVRLSALSTGRLYLQEILLVLIYVRGWVDPRAIVWSEGFYVNEKSTDTSWDRTSDLSICSTAP